MSLISMIEKMAELLNIGDRTTPTFKTLWKKFCKETDISSREELKKALDFVIRNLNLFDDPSDANSFISVLENELENISRDALR